MLKLCCRVRCYAGLWQGGDLMSSFPSLSYRLNAEESSAVTQLLDFGFLGKTMYDHDDIDSCSRCLLAALG